MSRQGRKLLFTPGPLNCPDEVREAMHLDVGSREPAFIECVATIRQLLLETAGLSSESDWCSVPMQGSGTFAIESALTTLIKKSDKLLVLENGAYGERMVTIARRAGLPVVRDQASPTDTHDPQHVAEILANDPDISHVAMVHCETTTGILNPIATLASTVKNTGRTVIVDAMSSFGALPLGLDSGDIDCIAASANKCLEGAPGCAFVILRQNLLEQAAGNCPSLSLDLHAQWEELERTGQFRFTPPTHVVLALRQALELLRREGGPAARRSRYQENHATLLRHMKPLGFEPVLPLALQSEIITAFPYPAAEAFDFDRFCQRLEERDLIIYPGKLSNLPCFRIGTIGDISPADVERLVREMETVLKEMGLR